MAKIGYDPRKRSRTLTLRGMDFDDAERIFDGPTIDWIDDRRDYGEIRVVTAGWLSGRMVMLVWTPRGDARHVISMRKANARERARLEKQFGQD